MRNFATNIKSNKNGKQSTRFIAEIVFGVKSSNCRNFGICKIIETTNKYDELTKQTWSNLAIINIISSKHVVFDFYKKTIKKKQFKKYFTLDYFIIQENVLFSSQKGNFEIRAGKYPTRKTEEYIQIIFKHK